MRLGSAPCAASKPSPYGSSLAEVTILEEGVRRAVVDGYPRTVDADNIATIAVPRGGAINFLTGEA